MEKRETFKTKEVNKLWIDKSLPIRPMNLLPRWRGRSVENRRIVGDFRHWRGSGGISIRRTDLVLKMSLNFEIFMKKWLPLWKYLCCCCCWIYPHSNFSPTNSHRAKRGRKMYSVRRTILQFVSFWRLKIITRKMIRRCLLVIKFNRQVATVGNVLESTKNEEKIKIYRE